jgi:hypothetical protein
VGSLFNGDASRKVRALVTKNSEGEWLRAFALDEPTNVLVAEAAWKAAQLLSDFHALTRVEFTGGW